MFSNWLDSRRWLFAGIPLLVLVVFRCGHVTAQESDDAPSLKAFCESHQGQNFYGIYMLGRKVGWMSDSLRIEESDRGETAIVEERGELRLKLFGAEHKMQFVSTYVYSLAGDGRLMHAEETNTESDSKSTSTADSEEGGYTVVLQSEGQTRRLHTGPSRDNLQSLRDVEAWLTQERTTGDSFVQYAFDFDKLSNAIAGDERVDPDEEETLTFVKNRTARWGGVSVTLSEVKAQVESLSAKMEVLPDGTPISFSVGPMKARLEEDVVAKDIELVVGDMLAIVPIERDLGPAERVRRATIELRKLGDFQVPETSRQQVVEKRPGFALLEIQAGRQPDAPAPLSAEDAAAFVAPTLRLPADHERIVSLARDIVGDEADRVKQATKLQDWVFANIAASYSKNADTALGVLDNLAGDCTENALLFVSLARALKIPARELGGLVFSNDPASGFYWHAWAEIHDGQRWLSIDPSFNEVGVDATHIKMTHGSDDHRWMEVMGRLKIRVRDFETVE